MKNKNFCPVELAFDNVAAAEWEAEKELKIENLLALKNHLSNFLFEVKDYNEFKANPSTILYDLVKNSYGHDFPAYIQPEALYSLVGLNLNEVYNLIHQVNSVSVQMDWNTHEATPPEFYTYTVNQKQNDAFHLIRYLINTMEQTGEKLTTHIYPMQVLKGLNGMVTFDFTTNKMIPNTNFILDLK